MLGVYVCVRVCVCVRVRSGRVWFSITLFFFVIFFFVLHRSLHFFSLSFALITFAHYEAITILKNTNNRLL